MQAPEEEMSEPATAVHGSPSGLPSSGLHTRKVAPAFSTHQTLARGFSMRCPPSSWDGRQERSSFSTRHDPSGASTPAARRARNPQRHMPWCAMY